MVNQQYGFRAKNSTSFAILDLINKITNAKEKGEIGVGVFIDLAKAFDTVPHEILLEKLYRYGIRGTAYELMKSYLSKRKQIVQYRGVTSEQQEIERGVPQGSILAPTCFILFINDLPNIAEFMELVIFADDTNLFFSDKDKSQLRKKIKHDLSTLVEWFRSNQLSLNVKKTNYMLFSRHKEKNNIDKEDIEIKQVEKTKFLGLILDDKLRWQDQMDVINNKVAKAIGILHGGRSNNGLLRKGLPD